MAGGLIRALTGKPQTRPTSPGSRTSRQPEPGGNPLISARAAVQTNRATSGHGSLLSAGEAGHDFEEDVGSGDKIGVRGGMFAHCEQSFLSGCPCWKLRPGSLWSDCPISSHRKRTRLCALGLIAIQLSRQLLNDTPRLLHMLAGGVGLANLEADDELALVLCLGQVDAAVRIDALDQLSVQRVEVGSRPWGIAEREQGQDWVRYKLEVG